MENTVTLRINDSFVFVQWLIRNAFTRKHSNYIYIFTKQSNSLLPSLTFRC